MNGVLWLFLTRSTDSLVFYLSASPALHVHVHVAWLHSSYHNSIAVIIGALNRFSCTVPHNFDLSFHALTTTARNIC